MGSVFALLRDWVRARLGADASDRAAALTLQRRFDLVREVGGFGVWEFDRPRRTIVADDRCLALLGLPEGLREFKPEDWLARVVEGDRASALSRARQWLDEPGGLSLRFRVRDRAGALRWLNAEFGRQRDGAGRHVGVLVDVTDDMTLGAERERALRRAELAVSVARGYFFDLDLVSGRLSRDPHAQALLDLPLDEASAGVEALFRGVPEFARPAAIGAAAEALAAGQTSFDLEVPIAGEGDSLRYFRTLAHIERDPDGRPVRIDGMSMEVTDSRRVRRELERVSTRFQLAAEAGRLGLYELDLRDNTVVQTPIGARLFGLPSGEPTPEVRYLQQIHAEDRGRVEETFRRAIEAGGGLEMVFRVGAGEGIRWVRSAGLLERNERGRPVRVAGVNWDITADIEARDRIARANDRLGLALAAANASVWEYAGDSDRITWDERGADLYGVDPNAQGRRSVLVAAEDRAEIGERLRALRADTGTAGFVLEYRIRHPRLGLRWVRCIGRRETAAGASGIRSVGIDIDVTAERTATEAVEQARQAAEAASRTKSAFLANMSHEIRTPMNAIIGMTGLAHRATSLAQSSSYAAQAHAAARSLLTVLNDVLDFSKIEAGRLDVEHIAFELESMLGPVLDVAGFAAGEKNLSVMLDVGPGVPARCVGDPARIAQILLNLTGNAVKFTEAGFVRLNVRRLDDARLRFEVVDSGVGLSAEQQREIFEPFTQGDPSTSRRFGGTGLGLTICRRLAGLMQGSLAVDSAPGRGAVFRLDLPLIVPEHPEPVWSPLGAPPPPLALAHGDAQVRGSLAAQFARLGADPHEFVDVASLECWLRTQAAASGPVVCVDPRLLPDPPIGWLGEQRARPCAPRIVLLGRRVSTMPPGELALLEPILPSALRRALDPAPIAASDPAAPGSAAEGEPCRVADDPGFLADTDILLVEDNDLNRALVIALLADSGAQVRIAHNGVQAVEAVRQQVPDVVLMDIHMPLMDGYAATAAIRALGPAGRDLPIIAITADALEGDRARALRAGMNDHLIKPLEPEALVAALKRWSRRDAVPSVPAAAPGMLAAGDPAGASRESAAPEGEPFAPLLDRDEGLRGCLGRPALLQQTLAMFVDIYEPVLTQLGSADHAADPSLDLGRLAHTLKGSVRALGMLRLAEVAIAIDAERRAGQPPTAARLDELRLVLALTLEQARAALAELSP